MVVLILFCVLVFLKLKMATGGRQRPTHFLAVKVKNGKILKYAESLQEEFKQLNRNITPALIDKEKMHITCTVLRLNDSDVGRLRDFLPSLKTTLNYYKPGKIQLTVKGLGCFNEKAGVVKIIREDTDLGVPGLDTFTQMINKMKQTLDENKFCVCDLERPYKPHITVVNVGLNQNKTEMEFLPTNILDRIKYDKAEEIGLQQVDSIQLMKTGSHKVLGEMVFD